MSFFSTGTGKESQLSRGETVILDTIDEEGNNRATGLASSVENSPAGKMQCTTNAYRLTKAKTQQFSSDFNLLKTPAPSANNKNCSTKNSGLMSDASPGSQAPTASPMQLKLSRMNSGLFSTNSNRAQVRCVIENRGEPFKRVYK